MFYVADSCASQDSSDNSDGNYNIATRPGKGAEYCDQPVCVSVSASVCLSVREHISGTAGPIGIKFCVQIRCVRGSVLFSVAYNELDTVNRTGLQ